MSDIQLQPSMHPAETLVSNLFIDKFMPQANGEFVKVYLYLLKTAQNAESFSLEQAADRLQCTEKDVLRALKFWEKQQIVSLAFSEKNVLNCIELLPVQDRRITQKTGDPGVKSSSRVLSPDRVNELKKDESIMQLLYVAEAYMGKTLSPNEMQKLLYFYDELEFPTDLIEYLIIYSVEHGHKSIRYMETVALAWKQEGITTPQMAKEANQNHHKEYYDILKAMGITGRSPVSEEISIMDTWLKDYGFDMAIIREACSRTVMQTGQVSFQYADRILSDWRAQNVKTLEDLVPIDEAHKKQQADKPRLQRSAPRRTSNRFNNFNQRDYDFSAYEKQLLTNTSSDANS